MKEKNIIANIDFILLSLLSALMVILFVSLISTFNLFFIILMLQYFTGIYHLLSSLVNVLLRHSNPVIVYYRKVHLFGSVGYLLFLILLSWLYAYYQSYFESGGQIEGLFYITFIVIIPQIIGILYWYLSYRDYLSRLPRVEVSHQ